MKEPELIEVEDYQRFIGDQVVERIIKKAEKLRDLHVTHVNSTYYGGGVAELLSSLTLLMNSVGIKTGWRVIQGSPDFFSITKKMHNALQGGTINLSDRKIEIYEEVVYQNAVRNHLDHDINSHGEGWNCRSTGCPATTETLRRRLRSVPGRQSADLMAVAERMRGVGMPLEKREMV